MMKKIALVVSLSAALVAVGAITETTEDMTSQGNWEITVASATPSTDMPQTRTKKKFRPTLRRPEAVMTNMGVLLSPLPRKMLMQQFPRLEKCEPQKKMRE